MPSSTTSHQSSWLTDIFLLSFILGLFYFFYLGSYPLFTPDEGRYSEVAREMLVTGDFVTPKVNGITFLDKPILYYWLQAIAISLFGLKEWALRFFPCLFGLIGILSTYVSGRLLYDRKTGLLAAAILATSPLYFIGAHYANLDLEVSTWISLSLFAFLIALRQNKPRWSYLILAYIFSACAFLTKGMIGIAFPVGIIGIWLFSLRRFQVFKTMRLDIGLIIFLAITTPWYYLAQKANPDFFNYFFVTQQITRFLSGADFNNKTPIWFYIPVIALGFFPWSIFLLQVAIDRIKKIRHSLTDYQIDLYLLIWISLIFLFFSVPHSKIITYILPIFPPLALLTARTLKEHWLTKTSNRYFSSGLIVSASLLAISILYLPLINGLSIDADFHFYLNMIASILIACALLAIMAIKEKKLTMLVSICLAGSALVLFTLNMGAEHLNNTSTKKLSTKLTPLLKPDDEIVNYYKFYQDLPLYLQKRVTIVADWTDPDIIFKDNWLREMWYGRKFQRDTSWLIDETDFWQRWHSGQRMYVFVNVNYLEQFKQQAERYFYVDKYNDILVLSNKPVLLKVLS